MKRREFIQRTGTAWAALSLGQHPQLWANRASRDVLVNDIHSQLNATRVHEIERPTSIDALQSVVRTCKREGRSISIAGSRHAMGGQQFGDQTTLIDMRGLNHILQYDDDKGEIEVEAGIEWPELIEDLLRVQIGQSRHWGIIQKQTGADRLSIGGALAANVHGRGLQLKPIINDVVSFTLVDGDGNVRTCSRRENRELFTLAIGGYGLFGILAGVTLRLLPRQKLQRVVSVLQVDELMASFDERIRAGFLYGDFQYSIAAGHDEYLHKGVFSCYRPVDDSTSMPNAQKVLDENDWRQLYHLSHSQKKQAVDDYTRHYLSTSGQIYWSDTHQLSAYVDGYHQRVDEQLGVKVRGSEMITEIYVPRDALVQFLSDVRNDFLQRQVNLIYGTVRLIEKDDESFLAWAKKPYACVIFNLHVDHDQAGKERAAQHFRRLIDRGIQHGGSYYLTYHRWATRCQLETCYPQFVDFLKLKKKYDPAERFQSEWYRHYKAMFASKL